MGIFNFSRIKRQKQVNKKTWHYIHFPPFEISYNVSTCFRNKNNLAEGCNRFAIDLDPSMCSRRSGITARLHIHALEMPATLFTQKQRLTKRRQCRCKNGLGLRAVFHWPIERSRTLNPLLLLYTLMNFVRGIFFTLFRNMYIVS